MTLTRALQATMTGGKEYNTKGGGHKDNLSFGNRDLAMCYFDTHHSSAMGGSLWDMPNILAVYCENGRRWRTAVAGE